MPKPRPMRRELMPLARTQMKIVLIVSVPLVLTCIVVSFFQTYFFLTSLQARGALQSNLAQQIIPISVMIAVITLLIMVPIFVLVAIWVSHRIVGPLQRLAREMQAIGEGRLNGTFTVREGDEVTFLGDAIETLRRSLVERVGLCRAAQKNLDAALAKMQTGEGDAKAVLSEAAQASAALRAGLDTFEAPSAPPASEPANPPQQ